MTSDEILKALASQNLTAYATSSVLLEEVSKLIAQVNNKDQATVLTELKERIAQKFEAEKAIMNTWRL